MARFFPGTEDLTRWCNQSRFIHIQMKKVWIIWYLLCEFIYKYE